MKIFTGNFANVKKYRNAGLHTVSIALSARYYSGDIYRPLNPEWSFRDDPEESYTIKFNTRLSNLNVDRVKKDLSLLSDGNDVILLCHEKYGDFCHRHLVNDWLNGNGEYLAHKEIKQKQLFE